MAVGSQGTSAVLTLRLTSVLAFLCSCRRCEMATLRSLTSAAHPQWGRRSRKPCRLPGPNRDHLESMCHQQQG